MSNNEEVPKDILDAETYLSKAAKEHTDCHDRGCKSGRNCQTFIELSLAAMNYVRATIEHTIPNRRREFHLNSGNQPDPQALQLLVAEMREVVAQEQRRNSGMPQGVTDILTSIFGPNITVIPIPPKQTRRRKGS